jgi:hypothetical protein
MCILLAQTDAFAPLISDAPGLPCKAAVQFNGDSTRVRFGTILNCATGVLVTTRDAGRYVM